MMWWVIPFFMIALFFYSLKSYFSSFVPFMIVFGLTFTFCVTLNKIDREWEFWNGMHHWGRFGVLMGSYTGLVLSAVFLTDTLHSYGAVRFFGGDPEGSFGMLYLPSVVFYLATGTIVSLVLSARAALKKHRA